MGEATALDDTFDTVLRELNAGEPGSLDRFASCVQGELRKLAASYLRREWSGDSLQPTELVNECYLRLFGKAIPKWGNRAHFFGIAARSMRQILVDRARKRGALKRPAGELRLTLDGLNLAHPEISWQVLALHQALEKLETVDRRLIQVIELRVFTGLSVEETARVLELAPSTVKRDWTFAVAWLHRELLQ